MESVVAHHIPGRYLVDDEKFPLAEIELLRAMKLLTLNVPKMYGGKGFGNTNGNGKILKTLHKIGSFNLSLARIYEGHLNAVLLIDTYGTPQQKHHYFQQVVSGMLFGIWNSELPSEPLYYRTNETEYILDGSKIFCSGGSNIHRPIVTAAGDNGTKMVVLQMEDYSLEEDMRYWKPMGMKSSVSCRFDFTGIRFQNNQILGGAYDYVKEPDFTSGAARFAAVQLGGASAAIRATVGHLKKMKRADASEQKTRLAKLAILRTTGNVWLKKMANVLDERFEKPSNAMYYTNMFRTVTREICEEVLQICEISVGLQGLMAPHPLERIHRDLSVYLKQPGPDRTVSAIGEEFIKFFPKE